LSIGLVAIPREGPSFFIGIPGGKEMLPPISVHDGLVITALFWEKTLEELEIAPGQVELSSAFTRPIPRTKEEQMFESRMTLLGPTPWTSLKNDAIHQLRLPEPTLQACAEGARAGQEACRVLEQLDGAPVSRCAHDCLLEEPSTLNPPVPIEALRPFSLGCPTVQWPEGQWVPGGEDNVFMPLCAPPPETVSVACPLGQHQPAGETACIPVGGACPAGDFTEKALSPPVIYVKLGSNGNGSTPASPLGSLQQAVDEAPPGSTVAVAKGDYPDNLILSKPVRIVGACAEQTALHAASADDAILAVHSATIEGLTLDATRPLSVVNGSTVTVDGLILWAAAQEPALSVRGEGVVRGRSLDIYRGNGLAIDVSERGQVVLDGVTSNVTNFVHVRGPSSRVALTRLASRLDELAVPRPVLVEDGALLELETSMIHNFKTSAIIVRGAGSRVSLRGVAFRSSPQSVAAESLALLVQNGAALTSTTVVIDRALYGGVLVEGSGSSARMKHTLIRDLGVESAFNIAVADGAEGTFEKVAFLRATSSPLRVCGLPLAECNEERNCGAGFGACARARIDGALMYGKNADDAPRYGVLAESGTRLDANGLLIADMKVGGVFVGASSIANIADARIGDLRTADVRCGVLLASGDSHLTLNRTELFDISKIGVEVAKSGSRAYLANVKVSEVGGGRRLDTCAEPALFASEGAELNLSGVELGGGGGIVYRDAFGIARDVEADGTGGSALCAGDGSVVEVERLRSVRTARVFANDAATELTAKDLDLRGAGLEILGLVLFKGERLYIDSPDTAITLDADRRSTLADVTLRAGAGGTGIDARSSFAQLERFDIAGGTYGLEIAKDATVETVAEGRITDYSEFGVALHDPAADPARFYFRMVYDDIARAVQIFE
jgi:hypothetical protein